MFPAGGGWVRCGSVGFGHHDAGSLGTHVFRRNRPGVAHAPRGGQGMTGEQADAFFDIAEPFSGLGLAAPLDFPRIYVDRPDGDGG